MKNENWLTELIAAAAFSEKRFSMNWSTTRRELRSDVLDEHRQGQDGEGYFRLVFDDRHIGRHYRTKGRRWKSAAAKPLTPGEKDDESGRLSSRTGARGRRMAPGTHAQSARRCPKAIFVRTGESVYRPPARAGGGGASRTPRCAGPWKIDRRYGRGRACRRLVPATPDRAQLPEPTLDAARALRDAIDAAKRRGSFSSRLSTRRATELAARVSSWRTGTESRSGSSSWPRKEADPTS